MIAVKSFGGRLGNWMFQYAALIGIKYKKNFECVVEKDQFNNSILENTFYLKEIPKVSYKPQLKNIYKESSFQFENGFFQMEDNTFIEGYFQNEKYFDHCKDAVKKEFEFKNEIKQKAKNIIQNLKQTVSVHVRRKDYITLSEIHPPCSLNYYEEAFQHFLKLDEPIFVVCSDDIEWCKKNFNTKKYNISFVDSNSVNELDMCIMSLCNHNIIANSTYSWWGAWLGETIQKTIVAPKRWFGVCEHTKRFNMLPAQIVPDRWIQL